MASAERDFEGGPAKANLRRNWDLPIIRLLRSKKARLLRYFGLPGPAIEDILEWRNELEHVTAVELLRRGRSEDDDRERHRRLKRNLLGQPIQFEIMSGFVEDILIAGHDIVGNMPPHRSQDPGTGVVRWRYDVLNLDFLGGAGYVTKAGGQPKRLTALRDVFRRQHGTEFVLFLTINVRDTLAGAVAEYLTQSRNRVQPSLHPIVDWYAGCGEGKSKYQLKAAIPAFVQHAAEGELFQVHCYPPVAYVGNSAATMVHFAFWCVPTSDRFVSVSPQGFDDLIRLPLLECSGTSIDIDGTQHDGFDWQYCYECLREVPPPLVKQLRASARTHLGGQAA